MQLLWLTQKLQKVMSKEGSVAVVGGHWSTKHSPLFAASGSGASESFWRLSKPFTLKYLLSANWALTGETLDTEMKMVTWDKAQILIRSISYATVALLQSFS